MDCVSILCALDAGDQAGYHQSHQGGRAEAAGARLEPIGIRPSRPSCRSPLTARLWRLAGRVADAAVLDEGVQAHFLRRHPPQPPSGTPRTPCLAMRRPLAAMLTRLVDVPSAGRFSVPNEAARQRPRATTAAVRAGSSGSAAATGAVAAGNKPLRAVRVHGMAGRTLRA